MRTRDQSYDRAKDVRREQQPLPRGHLRNLFCLGHASAAGHIGLNYVSSPLIDHFDETILCVFVLSGCYPDATVISYFQHTIDIVGRDRLLKPRDVLSLELPGDLTRDAREITHIRIDGQIDVRAYLLSNQLYSTNIVGRVEADLHLNRPESRLHKRLHLVHQVRVWFVEPP